MDEKCPKRFKKPKTRSEWHVVLKHMLNAHNLLTLTKPVSYSCLRKSTIGGLSVKGFKTYCLEEGCASFILPRRGHYFDETWYPGKGRKKSVLLVPLPWPCKDSINFISFCRTS